MVQGMRTRGGLRIWKMARAGGADLNPANYISRATSFSSAAGLLGDVTLLVHRTTSGLTGYLVTADRVGSEAAAMHLAQAVAARAEPVDVMPELTGVRRIGWLSYRPGSAVNRETQHGVDPSEAARRLAVAMTVGQWVAVSLRQPAQAEKRRHRRWLVARMGTSNPTHHSVTTGAVVVAVRAGAGSSAEVSSLLAQVASAMPGFDVDTYTRTAHPVRAVLGWVSAGLAVWAGLRWGADVPGWASAAGSAITGLGVLVALGVLPVPGAKLAAQAAAGRLRAPGGRWVPPRRPRKRKHRESGEVVQTEGDYPLAADGFMVAPNVVVGLVAPGAGALSGSSSTSERPTPAALREPVGPLVGDGTDGAPVFLSAPDAWSGVFLVGKAGSGKMQPLSARFPVPVSARFPDGWARNGELEVGDEVFTPDGSVTRVRGFSDPQVVDTYRVMLSDGQVVEAGPDHLWRVSTRYSRSMEPTGSGSSAAIVAAASRRAEDAAAVRRLASTFPAGMNATVADVARILGVSHGAVDSLIETAGLKHVRQQVTVRSAGRTRNSSTVVSYPAEAAVARLRQVAADTRSVLDARQVDRVASLGGQWLTADSIACALLQRDASRNEVEVVRARLRSLQGSRRSQVCATVQSRPVVRELCTYPVREVLHAWAARIVEGGRSPVESLVTTSDMAGATRTAGDHTNFAIRVPDAVPGPVAPLPVDPYLLGCWLGDGSSGAGTVVVGRDDIDHFRSELGSVGFTVVERNRPNRYGPVYYLTFNRPDLDRCRRGHRRTRGTPCTVCGSSGHRRSPDPVTNMSLSEHLVALGVKGAKRIPAVYLRGSVEQRLAVLQGLMDTDGTIGAGGGCELTLSDDDLARDALELIRSLGIKATSRTGRADYRGPDGERVACRPRHRIVFTTDRVVFRLPRKAARVPRSVRPTQRWLFVQDVVRAEPQPMRCIVVDHPSGMYLTDGFVATHNSQLCRSLFAWNAMERVTPSGRPGFPGRSNALVAFESKGDGAAQYLAWSKATGDRTLLVEVAEPAAPAIDLFAVPGSVADRAAFFANAMVYAFEPGSIQDRSFATLVQVFTAALAITPAVAGSVPGVDPNGSPMYFAHVLLAGRGDELGAALAGAVMSEAVRLEGAGSPDVSLSLARDALVPLFQGRTESARRQFLEAPANKVAQLLALDHWWSAGRPKTTWHQVLTEHRSVVVNTGVTTSGRIVEDRLSAQMGALLMFGLRDAIMRYCNGWQSQGRSVSVFADELSLLAGSSPEVVTWLRNQGRSYGVRPVLATQYPEQLADQVAAAVTGFSTLVAFAQDNPRVADELARDFSADGTSWSAADVVNLAPFTTIVRTTVGQQRQSAFTMGVRDFEADVASFVGTQVSAAGGGGQ